MNENLAALAADVVWAAIAWQAVNNFTLDTSTDEEWALQEAVRKLTSATKARAQELDRIQKGETETRQDVDGTQETCQDVDRIEEPGFHTWVTRTWRDVRDDDTVRMPGNPATETVVISAAFQIWHVDPSSSEYRPSVLEHSVVRVMFAGRDRAMEMNPAAPVEIRMEEMAARFLVDDDELWGMR